MGTSRPNRVSGTAGHRISGSPRSPRRPRGLASEARARPRAGRVQHDHARNRRARRRSRRGRARRRGASGPCAIPGIARRKTCILHGSRSSSMRRSTRRRRGRRCMKCCAIDRAISCSTIWVSAKTRWGLSFAPTAPTFRTFCARISRSRWDCRSGTRSARAAAAASRRSARSGGTFRIRGSPSRPARTKNRVSRHLFGMLRRSQSRRPATRLAPKPQGLAASFGYYLRNRRRWRSFRIRANAGERQQHRLLSRAAEAGDAAPGHHIRRSVRARFDAGEARAAVGRRGGRPPRGRRAARRDGRAKAFLARQFLVRAGSRAWQPRVQALPADRAREERRLAAADQRRNREKSAVRRFFARAVAARGRRLLRSNG